MSTLPAAALAVHHLPLAPSFTGREQELASLKSFWDGPAGVLAITGSGGAGKTALLAEFIRRVVKSRDFDKLLVWSFYDDPNTNAFLQTAFEHFGEAAEPRARGAGWFHLLKEALADGHRYLIVLDGLERVQRTQTDSKGIFGELEDPLLQGLLQRLAGGAGRTHAIITSRFPLTDLEGQLGEGHVVLDVDHMEANAACTLLRNRGVAGTVDELAGLVDAFGNHALTLDLLGGAVNEFFEGDPATVQRPNLSNLEPSAFQAMRLASVLRLYQTHLPERTVDLLSRLCVFRFGIDLQSLSTIFLSSPKAEVAGALAGADMSQLTDDLERLVNLHLVHRDERSGFTIHPAVRDHFYRLFRDPTLVHRAVSDHLMTLSARPGIGLPTESQSLNVLEELVYHAIRSGQTEQARSIYTDRLGGGEHLNTRLGEYLRCSRILQAFEECPDPGAMYHCQRAFGRFDEALKWRPQNTYIQLLTGKLRDLGKSESETARRAAHFLMGRSLVPPDRCPDYPLCAARFALYRQRYDDARRLALRDIELSLFEDDVVRSKFALAEAEFALGNHGQATKVFDEAASWTISSGSKEHLLWMHRLRAIMLEESHPRSALSVLEEAHQLAQESNFQLGLVEVLIVQSRVMTRLDRIEDATAAAQQALQFSDSPEMDFAWGREGALRAQAGIPGQDRESRSQLLERLRELQDNLDHPGVAATDQLLAGMRTT